MEIVKKKIPLKDVEKIRLILGVYDRNIKLLEEKLRVRIIWKQDFFLVEGKEPQVSQAEWIIKELASRAERGLSLKPQEVNELLRFSTSGTPFDNRFSDFKIEVYSKKGYIRPKTKGQLEYVKSIEDYDLVFSLGPAGTGKTYLAMACAVSWLLKGKVSRIILTRPAKEAGESLGFLPGNMQEKIGPYLRPLYDALYEMMEPERIEEYLETGVIEVAPLAYMRGRTLNSSFIILDEAQNITGEQMKMFLTRMGFDSKIVITADPTQSDLPGGKPSGLFEAIEVLKEIPAIKFVYLTGRDIVRHELVQEIIKAYEREKT